MITNCKAFLLRFAKLYAVSYSKEICCNSKAFLSISCLRHDADEISDQNDRRFDRPKMFQLEHIQKRLEYTTPLMFKSRMDYTFYRRDVVLEDKIFNAQRFGLNSVQLHFGMFGVLGQLSFPHIETQLLNVAPILEDGTVRLRWRVLYLNWFLALDPRNLKLENRIKKLKWYDGYSIFFVDGDGLVYKFTLQKIMPDDFKQRLNGERKKLAEKISNVIPSATNFVKLTPREKVDKKNL